jgi:tetratricopeptide (TPR) repeat protein
MKKYVLAGMMVLGSLYGSSQELPKDIRFNIELKQFDKAKEGLDKYIADPKNAASAIANYYKAYVYSALARDPKKTVAESKILNEEAFAALKKYTELDPKLTLTKEENNSTLFNIYFSYYDLGVKFYNEKNYPESYNLFKSSLDVHDYGVANKLNGPGTLKFALHDTDLVWNLAVLANELKKKDDALVYYKKIADADLKDEKYVTAYEELILKYKREKNTELFAKYIDAAKRHYPIDIPYWEMKEIEFALSDLQDEALLNKYEELTKSLPNNYIVFYNYAIEIDKFISSDASKGKDAAAINAYRTRIEELYKKALSIKPTLESNLQLANLYYSKTFDLQERIAKIKGTKPAELKVKNDLVAESKALTLASIPYAEEAVKILGTYKEYKFSDKSNYKLALEILGHGYKVSGDAAKLAEVEKKKLEVEKL